MSDVNEHTKFKKPSPQYSSNGLRGKLHCPYCKHTLRVRTDIANQ